MPRKTAKPRPPSLRDRTDSRNTPGARIDLDVMARWLDPKRTPAEVADLELSALQGFADDCDRRGLAKDATALRRQSRELEAARHRGDIDAAIVAALHIGRAVVSISRDAAFAPAVDAHKRSTGSLRNKPTVSDAQIRKYTRGVSRKVAAGKLGITTRQLRNRLKDLSD